MGFADGFSGRRWRSSCPVPLTAAPGRPGVPGPSRPAAVAGVALSLLLVLPLSGGPAGAESAGRTTFTVGITQDVDSLNPFTGIVASAYEMYQLTYDTLTDYGQEDFAAEPSIAESWETSDDGLTWTYTIREGVQWSDGEPLTARDVAYSFNRVMDGRYEQTNFGNYVSSLTSVEATDDRTVVMKTRTPTPHDAAPVRLHPPRAHLEGHRRQGGPQLHQRARAGRGRRVRAVHHHRAQEGPVHPARGEPEPLAGRAGRSTSWSSASSRTRTRSRRRCAAARSTSPTTSASNVYESLEGADGVTTYPASLLAASTRSRSTSARRSTTGHRSATGTRRWRTSGCASRSRTRSTPRR